MNGKLLDDLFPLTLELLLRDAVAQILEYEDPAGFYDWLRENLHEYFSSARPEPSVEPQDSAGIATVLGRAIWNATPLPGNDFRPRPLPAPGRNQPCPCGSGRKYKLCCARGSALPAFDSQLIWPFVLEQLPRDSCQEVIGRGLVPLTVLLELSYLHLEHHQPKKGVSLLEPLFAGLIRKPDEAHDYALNLLCDFYDELGHHKKKAALLQQIIATVRRSPLRSGALQRIAAIKMDDGDAPGAWKAFQEAQRDDPGSAGIGVLEVQLLIAEDRMTEAQARAEFWVMRLRRAGFTHDDRGLMFLSAVSRNPITAMKDIGLEMAGGAGEGLDEWLRGVAGRPVPEYRATTEPPEVGGIFGGAVETHLGDIGVVGEELEQTLAGLQQELELDIAGEQADVEEEADDPFDSLFLIPPPAVGNLEARWHDVFPLGKPFSVSEEPFGGEDAWDEEDEEAWMAILHDHPEAFDSLDIIDDLATALMQHDQSDTQWLDVTLLMPLLLRAASIIDHALTDFASPRIVWGFTENRPALRSLARLAALHLRAGEAADATAWARRLLALNPNDNHGFRSVVVNQLLVDGDYTGVLELAGKYPNDVQVEVPYGRVLAHYCLQCLEEAQDALYAAMEDFPKVVHYLTAKRVRAPKLSPVGVQYGGDDQAWLYREAMRDLWLETPGAIDWLKRTAKRPSER
jgi:tetratricopeptide (TPR) repeat protein